MTLPTTGPIGMGQVRTELNRTGVIALNDTDVRQLANKPSGLIAMSDLRGKSNGRQFAITVGYAEQISDKVMIPEGRGYWTFMRLFGYLATTALNATALAISEEDYQTLYDDGLVDQEPVIFFNLQATNAARIQTMSTGPTFPPEKGTLEPHLTAEGYEITAIYESTLDAAATSGSFIFEILGNTVPLAWFTRLEIYNSSGALVASFPRSTATEGGQRFVAYYGTDYTNQQPVTRWIWNVARGAVFNTSGNYTAVIV